MFWHSFKYAFRSLLRNRALMFWTLAFPFILAVLFNLAFARLHDYEQFEALEVAVIDDAGFSDEQYFKEAFSIPEYKEQFAQLYKLNPTNSYRTITIGDDDYLLYDNSRDIAMYENKGYWESLWESFIGNTDFNTSLPDIILNGSGNVMVTSKTTTFDNPIAVQSYIALQNTYDWYK